MSDVAVRIFHPEPGPEAGPLGRSLAAVRRAAADRLSAGFRAAGARDVAVVSGPPDDTPFGRRLRELVERERPGGLVVAGSGALVRSQPADLRAFLATAAGGRRAALANNRFSADAVAIGCAVTLLELPDLESDNGLPRWLAEAAGYEVRDLRSRARLQLDLDGPLDALLAGMAWPDPAATALVRERLAALAAVAADPRAELLVAGRLSGAVTRRLERAVPARTRLLVEERGLRAGTGNPRPPRSVLGLLLDRDGPAALGAIVAQLADAALVDSRVLLAHRLGPEERAWPPAEDRHASDLLLADRIGDPWLRALTQSAAASGVPILLGGHTLVGPGLAAALRFRA